ncbi:hypothetical protein RDI58_017529 [Solanum bulbocastanum]|uniref:Uncharacterized protein n=1 Tax=Solanum bulbocastanum TaxID=147425 RepID=A0AAN8Y8X8_SOLBU
MLGDRRRRTTTTTSTQSPPFPESQDPANNYNNKFIYGKFESLFPVFSLMVGELIGILTSLDFGKKALSGFGKKPLLILCPLHLWKIIFLDCLIVVFLLIDGALLSTIKNDP